MVLPYRVLDLTDDRGNLAGQLFAQLGADVIAVEPTGGQRARHLAPFANDEPGAERSLVHRSFNRGKRSVVLPDGSDLTLLAAGADVLLATQADPEELAGLRATNPRLVTVNITPFGETGPKAGWAATDLTLSAASGTMSLTGDEDRAPLRISEPVVWNFAALDATCAALLALHERRSSGLGQHASVSAQASYGSTNQYMMTYPLAGADPGGRVAGGIKLGPLQLQILNRCADGYVAAGFLFGPVFGPYTIRLWNWVHGEGGCPDSFLEVDWIGLGLALTTDPEALEIFDEGTRVLAAFLATKTKAEVTAAAAEHRLLACAVTETGDLLDSEHLVARGYWDEVDWTLSRSADNSSVDGSHVRQNGRFAVFGKSPLSSLDPAPSLGEHTDEVMAEIDPSPPVAAELASPATGELPLAGVKVLDFSWAIAGPEATRQLADYGATVIRVESEAKPDPVRGSGPFLGEAGGFENSISWHTINAGKLSFPMNIAEPEVRPVLEDLVRWADVVVESFSAGVLASHGMGPDRMLELNPELVVLSSTLAGQTGPMRELSGFGTTGAAVAGLYPTTGWPDRDPAGPWGPYTDFPAYRFGAIAVLAALDHQRREGGGQHIDFSQAEGAMHMIAPAFLDHQINGRAGTWTANADANMAPHGVYPVDGDDRWLAIACENDEQWAALASLMGSDASDAPLADRLSRREQLDAEVAAWTTDQDVATLEQLLQENGIAAHRMATAEDVLADPQLEHRDHYAKVPHPLHEHTWAERKGFDLDRTPAEVRRGGPTLGEHLWEVLTEHLGYDDDTASAWIATGALT
ncbi:MAG: CoA transferase [Acidimicrobiales bacterium]